MQPLAPRKCRHEFSAYSCDLGHAIVRGPRSCSASCSAVRGICRTSHHTRDVARPGQGTRDSRICLNWQGRAARLKCRCAVTSAGDDPNPGRVPARRNIAWPFLARGFKRAIAPGVNAIAGSFVIRCRNETPPSWTTGPASPVALRVHGAQERRERLFKWAIVITTCLVLGLALQSIPWGRFLLASARCQGRRQVIGMPSPGPRSTTTGGGFASWGSKTTRPRVERFYAEADPAISD